MKTNGGTAADDKMPSILDRELSDFSEDAFGHNHFAQALRHLIEGPHRPPYSIGLLGSWGTGKSTIKQLYLSSLENDPIGEKNKKRKDRIRPITFNAWRYGGEEDIKRSLLRHAFIQLGGDEPALHRELFQQVSHSTQVKRGFWDWLQEATLQNAASALILLVLFAAIVGVLALAAWHLGISGEWGLPVLILTAGTVTVFLAKNIVDIRLKSPTMFNPQTTISFPSTSAEEYEQLLLKQIERFRETPEGRRCERLVIFVDDLDRLSAPEMVSGLDAVRTFLELPIGGANDGFGVVFIISCDEDRVADALSPRGRLRVNPELPASVITRSDARRYLDRLFQFRLEIPDFPKLDMRQFAENKLRAAGSIAAEIERHGTRVQDIIERLIHVGVQSPRNAIQLLNAFMQTWWIAVQRERSGAGASTPGALYSGAVTNHPIALAAICVLRVDFPDFFNEMQRRPELVQEFTAIVLRNQPVTSISLGAQDALKKFLELDKNGELTSRVRPEHRVLRQYLSSLIGLRWPLSLQPLLLLSQDAVSRKYGDAAAPLHDAFVSGDVQGVLEVFGHHLDQDNLGRDDVRLLEGVAEGLPEETEARRISAALVLAAIADRIPPDYSAGLMLPLARQMVAIKDIRMNVGPALAGGVIESLPSNDRMDVADGYASDLLSGGKLEWRLPTGETPNLEELVREVKAAANLVLSVRARDGLLSDTEARLKDWLLKREVQSETGSQSLPFSDLEAWLADHESHLLELLGQAYSDQAIAEFESDASGIPDVPATLRRIAEIHTQLSESGQESREVLWEQLDRLVAVRYAGASEATSDSAGKHAASATAPQARSFLVAFAARLEKEMEDEESWELDRESGARQLLDLAARWQDHIDPNTAAELAQLFASWGKSDACADFMVRGAKLLFRRHREAWDSIADEITSTSLGKLPWSTLQYVGSNFESLTDKQKAALAGLMNTLVDIDDPHAEATPNYQKLVPAIPDAAWSASPLDAHADKLRTRLLALFNQPKYLAAYFPAARHTLAFAPNGQPAAFLKQLFEQVAGIPAAYPALHRDMADGWPEVDEQTGNYDPTGVVNRAVQFINENPGAKRIGYVLKSIVNLVDGDLANESVRPSVSAAAATLWSHDPDSVAECADKMAGYLTPADVRTIAAGTQPSEPKVDKMASVLRSVVDASNQDKLLAITKEVLSAPPTEFAGEPDGAFVTWGSALQDQSAAIFKSLVSDDGLNDDQQERVFRYAVSQRAALGLDFFLDTLPSLLATPAESKVLGAVVAKLDDIAGLASTSDARSALVSALIPSIPNVPRNAFPAVARVVRMAGGKAVLERASILEELDQDQLAVLAQEFSDSREIAQRLRRASEEPGHRGSA